MSHDARTAQNAAVNVAGLLVEVTGTALIIPYVILHLGLDRYGLITAVIAFSLSGQMVGQAVVATTLRSTSELHARTRDALHVVQDVRNTRGGLLLLVLVGAMVASLLLLAREQVIQWLDVPDELRQEGLDALLLMGWLSLPLMLSMLFPAILRGRQEFGTANRIKIVAAIMRVLGIVVWFETVGPSILAFVVWRILPYVGEGLGCLVVLIRRSRHAQRSSGADLTTSLINSRDMRMTLGLVGYALGNILLIEVSKLLVGRFYGLEVLGVVGASAMAVSFVQRFIQAGAVAVNPAVSALEVSKDLSGMNRLVGQGTLISAVTCTAIGILTMPVWEFLAPAWIGPDARELWVIPALLVAGQATVSSTSPMVQGAYGRGRVYAISAIYLSVAVLGLLAGIGVGVLGGGASTFVSAQVTIRVLGAVCFVVFVKRSIFDMIAQALMRRILLVMTAPWIAVVGVMWLHVGGRPIFESLGKVAVLEAAFALITWSWVLSGELRVAITERVRGLI